MGVTYSFLFAYYTVFYAWMMAAPPLAGAIADQVGSVRIVFILGGAIVVVSMLALGLFRRINTVAQVID